MVKNLQMNIIIYFELPINESDESDKEIIDKMSNNFKITKEQLIKNKKKTFNVKIFKRI